MLHDMFFPMEMISFLKFKIDITFGMNFDPLFGHPVEYINCIEPLFVGASTTKNDYSIILWIIAHGAVWSLRGDITCSLYLSPFHSGSIEGPNIIHIDRFLIMNICTCIAPEKHNFIANNTTTMPPSRNRLAISYEIKVDSMPGVFFHHYFPIEILSIIE